MRRFAHLLLLAMMLAATVARAEKAGWIKVEGAIGPAAASYITRSLHEAGEQQLQCLVIQLDTPGGLLESTKVIVTALLGSPVPTIIYVAPSGATATSAGCFITLAADVAAMAPATTIGAAHPVQLGGGGEKPDETMTKKVENYAISYIETIAAKRKRNVEWAKSAVKESASITADKALELKVIELIAKDRDDLLRQLDGREINGKKLSTAGAEVVAIEMSLAERLLHTLLRPEALFIFMLVALYGIIGELSNPGAIFPGVVGAIALILMLYMTAILPVNIAGFAFIALAVALFAIDVFAPTHGILTAGGVISFLIGSLMLFDRAEPVFKLSLAFIIPATVLTALFFAFIVSKGLRAQLLPVKSGTSTMIGRTVESIARIDATSGKVFIEGEYWNAVSDVPIEAGQPVEITEIKGLTLKVKPKAT